MTKGHVLARAPSVSSPSIDKWTISSVVTNLILYFLRFTPSHTANCHVCRMYLGVYILNRFP